MDSRKIKGFRAESEAVEYLAGKGYHILERNYRFDRGEIDIVARYGKELVFVEVKARSSSAYGEPEDALTPYKCRQIQRVADGYLQEHGLDEIEYRFDIVAIEYRPRATILRHLRDAF